MYNAVTLNRYAEQSLFLIEKSVGCTSILPNGFNINWYCF